MGKQMHQILPCFYFTCMQQHTYRICLCLIGMFGIVWVFNEHLNHPYGSKRYSTMMYVEGFFNNYNQLLWVIWSWEIRRGKLKLVDVEQF